MKHIVLPEIVAAGIYNSQIVFKGRAISPNRKTTMFELELPIEEGGTSYIDDVSHVISNSLVICAKPGQLRHTRLPFKCYYVHMIVREGYLFDVLSALPCYIELQDSAPVRDLFAAFCEHYHAGTARSELMLQSLLLKLIYTLDAHSVASGVAYHPRSSNREAIEQTVCYVREHLAEQLTLATLSARFNFSPVYFHKLFKASTGKNLREYIEDQRIKRAIELLLSTEKTLAEIAYECGFSSQSYFSYAFKRKKGVTPREYGKTVQMTYEK